MIKFNTLQTLTENSRVDFLRNKFREPLMKHLFPAIAETNPFYDKQYNQVFDKIAAADPTRNHQYLQWILTLAARGNIQLTDLEKVHEDLTLFERVKQRVPVERRDINRYKQYQDLYDVIQEFGQAKSTVGINHAEIAKFGKDIKTYYEGPEGAIYSPQTIASSQYLGKGTRWCTAALQNNYFESYHKRGPLIVFINRKGEKFQKHAVGSDNVGLGLDLHTYENDPEGFMKAFYQGHEEFMDSSDRSVGSSHEFIKDPLYLKWVEMNNKNQLPKLLMMALKEFNVKALHDAMAHPAGAALIRAIKADAPECIAMYKSGVLKRFEQYGKMYIFIDENVR